MSIQTFKSVAPDRIESKLGLSLGFLGLVEGLSLFVVTAHIYVGTYTSLVGSGALLWMTVGPFIVLSWGVWAIVILACYGIGVMLGDWIARQVASVK